MSYGYVAVEGPHDVEFVGRLLKLRGLSRVRLVEQLEELWRPLTARSFPPEGDLLKRVPIPTFFQNNDHSIAVESVIGDSRLGETIRDYLDVKPELFLGLTGIGLVLDADDATPPLHRFQSLRTSLVQETHLQWPERPGHVSASTPCCGIYVLPDNHSPGTIEDIFVECAELVYPELLQAARNYVSLAETVVSQLPREESRDFFKPAGRQKARVNTNSSVLRPGKAVQVSIQDNRWIGQLTENLPRIRAMMNFLDELLQLSPHPSGMPDA